MQVTTINVPVWGAATPQGVDCIVARLLFSNAPRVIMPAVEETLIEISPSGGNS